MGTWGPGNFENDAALDWVWELEEDTDGSALRTALISVVDDSPTDDFESDICRALAAAAVVAHALKASGEPLPDEAASWLASHDHTIDEELVDHAQNAVIRVHSLWVGQSDNDEWTAVVEKLAVDLGLVRRPDPGA